MSDSSQYAVPFIKLNIPGFPNNWLFLGTAALLPAFPSFSSHVHCANSQYPSVANSTDHAKKNKIKKSIHSIYRKCHNTV